MQAAMHAATHKVSVPATRPVVGRVISGLAVVFLVFDGAIKVLRLDPAVEGSVALGYPADLTLGLGVLLLGCLLVYVAPRTAFLGALLLTGYLGGAVASQVRVGAPLFSVVFPLIVGALLWGGLYLRDARLRALLSLR
jgi:hypothetical protein